VKKDMVLTIEKLQLQVAELEKNLSLMDSSGNLIFNLEKLITDFRSNVSSMKAGINLIRKQIEELEKEKA